MHLRSTRIKTHVSLMVKANFGVVNVVYSRFASMTGGRGCKGTRSTRAEARRVLRALMADSFIDPAALAKLAEEDTRHQSTLLSFIRSCHDFGVDSGQ